mmetsp:Transcript_96386/g.167406  ORF Transcript_96386/g.167406 Transcript_96386/m.167406 type:complete len:228 (+) Transcript_96386:177-860(+)
MLLQEVVQPREDALIWQAYGKDHLTSVNSWDGRNLHVRFRSIIQHAASERQLSQRCRSKVHLQCHVLVGNRCIERLAEEALRQPPRRADADAVAEGSNGASGVRPTLKHHSNGLASTKRLGQWTLPHTIATKHTFRIDKHLHFFSVKQDRCARRCEANSHQTSGQRAKGAVLLRAPGTAEHLHDSHLKHITSFFDSRIHSGTSQQVLKATITECHEKAPISRKQRIG